MAKVLACCSELKGEMIVLGLTGGIGSGKSTISEMLSELGAVVVNADKIGHEAYSPHTKTWREIITAFGKLLAKMRRLTAASWGRSPSTTLNS